MRNHDESHLEDDEISVGAALTRMQEEMVSTRQQPPKKPLFKASNVPKLSIFKSFAGLGGKYFLGTVIQTATGKEETRHDDWRSQDFHIEHKDWMELADEHKAAINDFGCIRITRDMTSEVLVKDDGSAPAAKLSTSVTKSAPIGSSAPAPKKEEQKKEAVAPDQSSAAPKPSFTCSESFGGGGSAFDDGNHESIRKILIFGCGIVDSIQLTYENGPATKHGGNGGTEHSLELDIDEYFNSVIVLHGDLVQSLTFITNKGNMVKAGANSSCDSLLYDKQGEESKVKAPNGMKLCGITGRSGQYLDSIAFRWGALDVHTPTH